MRLHLAQPWPACVNFWPLTRTSLAQCTWEGPANARSSLLFQTTVTCSSMLTFGTLSYHPHGSNLIGSGDGVTTDVFSRATEASVRRRPRIPPNRPTDVIGPLTAPRSAAGALRKGDPEIPATHMSQSVARAWPGSPGATSRSVWLRGPRVRAARNGDPWQTLKKAESRALPPPHPLPSRAAPYHTCCDSAGTIRHFLSQCSGAFGSRAEPGGRCSV